MSLIKESSCKSQTGVTVQVTTAGAGQEFLVASSPSETDAFKAAFDSYSHIAEILSQKGMAIVHERIFGSLNAETAVMAARKKALESGSIPFKSPVTYIQGHPPWGEGFSGVLIQAVGSTGPGDGVWTVMDGNVPCGRGWQCGGATFLTLQNIQGLNDDTVQVPDPAAQAQRMIKRAERILREQGLTFRNVIRTWFYLSKILTWYGEFNTARNALYDTYGIIPTSSNDRLLLPASTGIEGDTPQGAAGTLDLIAMAGPMGSHPLVKQLSNAHQLDAFRYNSAFSRGALICNADVHLIQVSGTAAIDEAGVSLYPGDVRAQIECTFDKIEALIGQEGAGLEDICSATAFVKRPEDAVHFWEIAGKRGLKDFPGICVMADICRDELLFEIDAEVAFPRVRSTTRPSLTTRSATTTDQCTVLPLHRKG
jgi:enamine deaminase RidA (YjgF/YER057c/UK114 family)